MDVCQAKVSDLADLCERQVARRGSVRSFSSISEDTKSSVKLTQLNLILRECRPNLCHFYKRNNNYLGFKNILNHK